MDVKARKILSCNGSFHVNSDINRLYTKRDKGGRGVNSIADVYIARIISISRHLTIPNKNEKLTNEWLKKGNLSSHIEGYICAIQEEEINTHYLKSKRNNNINPICRLCKQQNKTIQHVVASCPSISASMYLPFRHDKVAYITYKQMLTNKQDEKVHVQEFYKDDSIEVWWDTKIKTLQKIQHNRPDIVVWKNKEKLCFIIDVSIGLDVNVEKNYELKHSSYLPLAVELKRLYEDHKFEVAPIVVGATGLVTNTLAKSLEKLGVSDRKATIRSCQKKALLGTLKIVKNFMRM